MVLPLAVSIFFGRSGGILFLIAFIVFICFCLWLAYTRYQEVERIREQYDRDFDDFGKVEERNDTL